MFSCFFQTSKATSDSSRRSCRRLLQFIVNESVIEPRRRGISGSACVKDARRAGPVDCALAHGARLASGIEVAAGKLKIMESAAGFANGDDFGVRGGIVARSDAVCSLSDNAAIIHDQRRERAAA